MKKVFYLTSLKFILIALICSAFLFTGVHLQYYDSTRASISLVILIMCLNIICSYKYDFKKSIILLFCTEVLLWIAVLLLGIGRAFIYAFIISCILNFCISLLFRFQIRINRNVGSRIVGVLLILSIVFFSVCICRSTLYLHTMQDYKSVYEIQTVESPDSSRQAVLYMYEFNEKEKYVIIASVREKNGKERNIAIFEKDSLQLNMKWNSNHQLMIDGDSFVASSSYPW